VVGVGLGLVAGRLRDSPADVTIRLFGIVIYAVPPFFLGFLAQLLFGQYLHLLPTSGRASPETQFLLPVHTHLYLVDAVIEGDWATFKDVVLHLILPATTLGLIISGVLIRLVRVNVLQTLKGDYIEAARARGVGERARAGARRARRPALDPVGRGRAHPLLHLPGGGGAMDLAVRLRPVPGRRRAPLPQAGASVVGAPLRHERAVDRRAVARDLR